MCQEIRDETYVHKDSLVLGPIKIEFLLKHEPENVQT